MDKFTKLLNIPPPPLSLPVELELEDELPKADDPIFLEPEIKSIRNLYNYQVFKYTIFYIIYRIILL
jgi:hypothetical protein